jgi:hypothetical protein
MGWLQSVMQMVLADEAGLTCRGVMTWRFSGQFPAAVAVDGLAAVRDADGAC